MKASKRQKLEAAGWRVGSSSAFLGLTEEEDALITMKLALAKNLKERREERRLTQLQLAKRLGSSQSRLAKMEAADESVSMELLVRSLLSLGASRKEIGTIIGARVVKRKRARSVGKKLVKS